MAAHLPGMQPGATLGGDIVLDTQTVSSDAMGCWWLLRCGDLGLALIP